MFPGLSSPRFHHAQNVLLLFQNVRTIVPCLYLLACRSFVDNFYVCSSCLAVLLYKPLWAILLSSSSTTLHKDAFPKGSSLSGHVLVATLLKLQVKSRRLQLGLRWGVFLSFWRLWKPSGKLVLTLNFDLPHTNTKRLESHPICRVWTMNLKHDYKHLMTRL